MIELLACGSPYIATAVSSLRKLGSSDTLIRFNNSPATLAGIVRIPQYREDGQGIHTNASNYGITETDWKTVKVHEDIAAEHDI